MGIIIGRSPIRQPARVLAGLIAGLLSLLLIACGDDAPPAADAATGEPGAASTQTPADNETQDAREGGPRVAEAGSTVAVHYRGTLSNGEEFDSSHGREPLTFEVGSGQVIEGFDQAVLGMTEGEKKTVELPPDQAYGQRRDDLVVTVPAEQAPEGLAPGQQVQLGNAPATVVQVTDSEVTVDANHPLAGEALTFEIELVSVQ